MSTHMQAQDRMFHRISDFAFARNAKQALGFYLFHLTLGSLGFLLAVVCKLLFGLPEGDAALLTLSKVATALALLYIGYLTYRLLEAKNRLGQPKMWALAMLGLGLSLAGMLLGLVVAACLSILRPLPVTAKGSLVSEEKQP
jgi:hypothetical protein